MRRGFLLAIAALLLAPVLRGQQVVDRIVARVEDDILTLSELRELGHFQELVEGRAADDQKLLGELIEQWMVNTEATAAHFPRPSEEDVTREVERLVKQLGSPEAYRERLRALGLSNSAVRRLVERQIYFARYLDYKFRPSAQVGAAAVERYYREQLLPPLRSRGQPLPSLEAVQDQIRELLVQRDISERAAKWVDEARARLKIEILLRGHGS